MHSNFGNLGWWSLLTGGHCSEVALCFEKLNMGPTALQAGGRYTEKVVSLGLTVSLYFTEEICQLPDYSGAATSGSTCAVLDGVPVCCGGDDFQVVYRNCSKFNKAANYTWEPVCEPKRFHKKKTRSFFLTLKIPKFYDSLQAHYKVAAYKRNYVGKTKKKSLTVSVKLFFLDSTHLFHFP